MEKRVNPETLITRQIRAMLDLMKVPHFKHFAGALSPRGIPDLIGVLAPSGTALFIEIKVPGRLPSPEQAEFLARMAQAGAVAFFATSVQEVVKKLAEAGFEPAARIQIQFPNGL